MATMDLKIDCDGVTQAVTIPVGLGSIVVHLDPSGVLINILSPTRDVVLRAWASTEEVNAGKLVPDEG